MFIVFNEVYSEDYSTKCELLLKNHIALWDMVHSGNRKGSLDSDIKNEIPNDIEGLLNQYQGISTILLNGKKAEAMYNRYFSQIPINTITLPSTSPANARLNFEEKLKLWKEAINPLNQA